MVKGIIINVNAEIKYFDYNDISDIINDDCKVLEQIQHGDNEIYLILGSFNTNEPFNRFDLLTCNPNGEIYIIKLINGKYSNASFNKFINIHHYTEDIKSENETENSLSSNDDYDYDDRFLVKD